MDIEVLATEAFWLVDDCGARHECGYGGYPHCKHALGAACTRRAAAGARLQYSRSIVREFVASFLGKKTEEQLREINMRKAVAALLRIRNRNTYIEGAETVRSIDGDDATQALCLLGETDL